MIIVGLGNPGEEFHGTRHNVGFAALDFLVQELRLDDWSKDRDVLSTRFQDHLLIKPQTYMNKSGQALRDFFTWHSLSSESANLHSQLIVLHDELDFELGVMKTQRDRSSAGHNGVQSLIDAFQTKDFTRWRIGIGNNQALNIPAEDYVLQRFAPAERETLQSVFQDVARLVQDLSPKI